MKEYTSEVKENLGDAKKIVEEFKPSVESYKEKALASFDKIKDQISNIKKMLMHQTFKKKSKILLINQVKL